MTALAPQRFSAQAWGLWALAMAALFLLRLGAAPLFDVDEGAFAEASREMLASGDWLHTTLNGRDRFDKPIGVYWLQASSLALFGVNEFAARLPSALCGLGWVLALAGFARPRFGDATAMFAATALGSSLGVLLIGRAATADALLNLLLVLTLLDLWRHLESSAGRPWALRRAALWAGLGVLTKGPVAVLIPFATLLLWLWRQQGLRALPRAAWRTLAEPGALGLFFLAWAPWYAYALQRHGWAFIDGFLLQHNLQRFSSPLEGHGGGPLYYLLMLPLLSLPWTPLLAAALLQIRRHWQQPLPSFLICWAGFVLVFFSLSGTKLPHYVLYGLTPWLLLGAISLSSPLSRAWRWALAASAAGLAALLGGLMAAAASGRLTAGKTGLYAELISAAPALPSFAPGLLGLVLAMLLLLWLWPRLSLPQAALGTALLSGGLLVTVVVPWWGQVLQGPVRAAALQAAQRDPSLPGQVWLWRSQTPSFGFYRQQPTPGQPEPRAGDWVFTRADELKSAPPSMAYEILRPGPGYVLLQWMDKGERP
jgi:4-amino-4-deoxy-L-arabinose transferase-like glycosyltransferase